MVIKDEHAISVMNHLARPIETDPAVVSGESGGVGLAGLMRVAEDASLCTRIGLNSNSRVLVFNTEGATDLSRYKKIVGLSPLMVSAALPCDGI